MKKEFYTIIKEVYELEQDLLDENLFEKAVSSKIEEGESFVPKSGDKLNV